MMCRNHLWFACAWHLGQSWSRSALFLRRLYGRPHQLGLLGWVCHKLTNQSRISRMLSGRKRVERTAAEDNLSVNPSCVSSTLGFAESVFSFVNGKNAFLRGLLKWPRKTQTNTKLASNNYDYCDLSRFFLKNIDFFIWLQNVESSSLTRDWTWTACIGSLES